MADEIQRVYTFLAKQENWETKADANGDQAIFKSEFRTYMEENFDWNGENANEKNDLINTFWNTIDTNQSGRINGTNFKNKNAIDKKELASMEDKIEMYEILNNYTESLTVPSVVSNSSGWKKSVSEGLGNLIEPYIKNGGKPENLQAYLEEAAKTIKQKTTADYCATEYIENNLKQYLEEYNYKYSEDKTLKGIIDNYIQNIPENANDNDIQNTVQRIVDAYVQIAIPDKDENPDSIDLSEYGYNHDENTPLNDLQKSIIKTKIEANLVAVKDLENYIDFKEEYDSAVEAFITNILENSKHKDYNLDVDWFNEFTTNSKEYKNILKTIEVNKFVKNGDLHNKLTSELGEEFANRLKNILPGEIKIYDEIINEAKELAQKGEFDNTAGELDTELLGKWLISKIKTNIKDFYPNGLGDMSIENLNKTYDTLVKTARENEDANGIKFATIDYCKAISAKSDLLAKAVKEIFGNNYAETIGKMLTSEIDAKIIELKAKVDEIGDINTFTLSSINTNLTNDQVYDLNSTEYFNLSATINKKDGTSIPNDRINFNIKTSGGLECSYDKSNNSIKIKGLKPGEHTLTIQTLVDGKPIGEAKTYTVKIKENNANLVSKVQNWNNTVVEHLEAMTGADGNNIGSNLTESSFSDLYNKDAKIVLHWQKDARHHDWGSKKSLIQGRLLNLCNAISNALAGSGLDKTKLEKAADIVYKNYSDNCIKNKNNHGSTPANGYNYMNDNRVSTKGKIVWTVDTDGKDSNIYMVHFKDLVDDILNEYQKL